MKKQTQMSFAARYPLVVLGGAVLGVVGFVWVSVLWRPTPHSAPQVDTAVPQPAVNRSVAAASPSPAVQPAPGLPSSVEARLSSPPRVSDPDNEFAERDADPEVVARRDEEERRLRRLRSGN